MSISKETSLFKKLLEQNVFTIGEALELGCGKSLDSRAFAKAGFKVKAVDQSEENISHIRERALNENQEIEAIQADISTFNIEKDYYDLVSCQYTLQFLEKEISKKVIEKMVDGCKNKGVIIFTLIGNKDEWKEKWSTWDKQEALDFLSTFPISIRNIILEEGFDQTKMGKLKYWDVMTFVVIKN